jgi:hypothetical protein
MSYDPNAGWSARAALPHQAPVYFIAVEDVAQRYSTGGIKGATASYSKLLRTPRGSTQEIFPLEGKSSIGTLSLSLVDRGDEISALLSPGLSVPTWLNRRITLYGGYADLDEADYAPLFTGEVSDWSMKDAEYSVKLRDLKRNSLEEIMRNASEDNPTVLQGNPVDIWYAIVTGDFGNPDFPVTSSGAAPTGLGVDASLLDEEHLAHERDEWIFGWQLRFEFRRKEKAKDFFEKELFLLKGYPLIRASGNLSVRLYHPAHPAEPEILLDENAVIGTPSVAPLFDKHLNVIEIWGDHNPDYDSEAGETEYRLLYRFEDSSDIAATRERRELIVKSRGLRTELDGDRNARFAAGKIRQRFLNPPLEFEAETLFSKRSIEAGDVVSLTHKNLPDQRTGARGLAAEQCEVVKVNPDFRKGVMRLTLWTANTRKLYRVVAPALDGGSPFPDYGSQTAAQRARYLSIADTATEEFSNGDPAHQVI